MSTRKEPQQGSATGKSLAVFTSGGDSQGMNAAVRACVRMAVYLGCQPYFIHEGYQGLVDGGDNITPAKWVSVSSIIHRGGTVIGSARCAEFRERAGRKKAAYNLVSRGISNLVVIGGDGSLTGANTLREEWPGLLDELLSTGEITKQQRQDYSALNIVGMVGTIDNDFCGTDMTIGADSALHRIIEVVDSVASTASSHQRTFIIETMGAHCGFLALQTAIASEADYVFIPESPPPRDWPEQICQKITQERQSGQRLNIIIVAEGALDRDGNRLTAETIKKVVSEQLQQDLRINVLGHMQRGGFPSAYDRIMASRVGAEATVALMEATCDTPPVVIGIVNNEIVRVPMMKSVQQTLSLKAAMAQKNWDAAMDLRGPAFAEEWNLFQRATRVRRTASEAKSDGVRLAVMHIGVPACGMNAAVRAFVINSIHEGFTPLGIYDGMDGLFKGNIKELKWKDVCGWVAEGGAHLCTKDTMAEEDLGQLARRLREFNIQGLLFIGSFRGYASCLQMFNERPNYPEFRIPMCVIPATIDNNMPGTEISIGSDTSLNEITEICDRIRQSAQGTKQRVFVIETMGAYCGYLATLAAIAGGADSAYIFEEPFSVRTLLEDARYMRAKMAEDVQRGLILCNENASENYSTDFIHRLYKEEGKDAFSCRMNVLGHMQQGGTPSPFDRILGVHMGTKCVDWFKSIMHSEKVSNNQTACLLGYQQGKFKFTPIQDLVADSNFVQFLPKTQWWLKLRPLLKILAKHESAYMSDKRNRLPEPQTNAATANCNVNANNSEAQTEACRRAGACERAGACRRANDENMNTQIKAVEKEQMERRERSQSSTSMLPHRYAHLSWPNSLIKALHKRAVNVYNLQNISRSHVDNICKLIEKFKQYNYSNIIQFLIEFVFQSQLTFFQLIFFHTV